MPRVSQLANEGGATNDRDCRAVAVIYDDILLTVKWAVVSA